MSNRSRNQSALLGALLTFATFLAQDPQNQKLDREYQSAVSDYDGGRYAAAANQLERLLPYAPKSFEIHELYLYTLLSQHAKAEEHQNRRPVEARLCGRTNKPWNQPSSRRETAPGRRAVPQSAATRS